MGELQIERALTTEQRAMAATFVNANHSYIKYADRPSRKCYWLLYEDNSIVGVFGLGSAFSRPKPVSVYMTNHSLLFNEVANNIVFCLAGTSVPNAGTRFLKQLRVDARQWWNERYGDTLKAMQTFILPPRTGAVYKADNWELLGITTGGATFSVRTLYGEERTNHPEAEVRMFKSGETKYLLREWHKTSPKLIFMRLV